MSGSRSFWTAVACALAVWLAPARANAYVWMLKHRYAACATCHVDPCGQLRRGRGERRRGR